MATLYNQKVKNTFPDLLTVLGATAGEGLTNSPKQIFDGDGTGSPLWMAANTLKMTDSIIIYGTLNLKEKSSTPSNPTDGDLAFISGELYIAK
tara:strand:- start:910 stop:1188 length:279 start_codon:yes stop_codon:yes gene_type:complete